VREMVMPVFWETTAMYAEGAAEAMERNASCWPIDKDYATEIERMKDWLLKRRNHLDEVIANYPAGEIIQGSR